MLKIEENYKILDDGRVLSRVYSTTDKMIKENATGILYYEVINADLSIDQFTETDIDQEDYIPSEVDYE